MLAMVLLALHHAVASVCTSGQRAMSLCAYQFVKIRRLFLVRALNILGPFNDNKTRKFIQKMAIDVVYLRRNICIHNYIII